MTDKVKCPYCGKEIDYNPKQVHSIKLANGGTKYLYKCQLCNMFSQSKLDEHYKPFIFR